jgi:hypothetical protein
MEIIDSLYHNFYIPPVIFAVMRDEDGEEVRICVDGKQRLTSIVKFLDGHVRPPLFPPLSPCMKLITLCYRLGVRDRLSYFSLAVCDVKCTSDRDPDTRKLWWYQVPAAHRGRRNEITPEGRRKFEDKRITCGTRHLIGEVLILMTNRNQVEYRALSPASEREVFQRVQLGMSLSAAGALPLAFSG